MTRYSTQTFCRLCGSPIGVVLDLGDIYPSQFLTEDYGGATRVPLTLARCTHCSLVQLKHTVEPDEMYRTYYYRSGLNVSMVAALQDVVNEALKVVPVKAGDVVCDIACNDTTLLSMYPRTLFRIGFDPAQNLPINQNSFDCFVNDYFDSSRYPFKYGKAKIVTAVAMFYDLPDPNDFTRQVKEILHKDGVWIIQLSDLVSMLETNAFDNICHEHLEYYSAWDIIQLMRQFHLEVFRITRNVVNGGSLRFFIGHKGRFEVEESVRDALMDESIFFGSAEGTVDAFARRVRLIGYTVVNFLIAAKYSQQSVYGLAASTKGNTLLQYFGINSELVQKIGDVNEDKYGKRTIGSDIPIISEAQALQENPDYFLLLAWHFIDTINLKLIDYLRRGGKIIVPMPEPRIYFHHNGGIRSELLEKMPVEGI